MARIDKAKLEEIANTLSTLFSQEYKANLEERLSQANNFGDNPYKAGLMQNERVNEDNFNEFRGPVNKFLESLAETCGFVLKVESADMSTTQQVEVKDVEVIEASKITVM